MDPDLDPAIFVSDLQTKKLNSFLFFASLPYFLKVHLHHFSKKSYRSHKTVGINVFLTIFA